VNPEIKAKWLEALRSGKYKQTIEALRGPIWERPEPEPDADPYADEPEPIFRGQGFCCLGVLCDVLHPEDWKGENPRYDFSHRGENGLPADSIREESGLTEEVCNKLAELNDAGKTFVELADHIDKTL
jgi:hypothetical protein